MIIDSISDLHGHHPELDGGDLLIVAGDFTARDTEIEHVQFCYWLSRLPYRKKIIVGGNHDGGWVSQKPHKGPDPINPNYEWYEYLCDSGTEFEYEEPDYDFMNTSTSSADGPVIYKKTKLKIWGSPWTKTFEGINPRCKAFTVDTEEELAEKWALIPDDIDILITHNPSFGNYDWIKNDDGSIGPSVGSVSLWMKCLEMRPKLHIFGHIHEAYGHFQHQNGIIIANASHVNEHYKPINKPIRIEL